ncbi:MAG: hypothetical protein MUF38_19995, partial [Anaerolineae bacterium]|nr:hypothetical protein [Anaerolineae bacterium]
SAPLNAVIQLQRSIGNRATRQLLQRLSQTGDNRLQRLIIGYKSGRTIAKNTIVMKGLNEQQREQIQQLHHDDGNSYTIDQARQIVGAAPMDSGGSTSNSMTPPFPFRYDKKGGQTMETISSGMGGLVHYPMGGMPDTSETIPQMSFSLGQTYGDLPQTSKRNVTQSRVMENVSPNRAAEELGFPCPHNRAWEWLHLVAFSIGETHVPDLSSRSEALLERTNQPQQIRENLVLGTAAANTEMLSYETGLKRKMKESPNLKLNLVVIAMKEDMDVFGKTIPVATSIKYHFYFETAPNTYTAPVIIEFDTMNHTKPATMSFEQVVNALGESLQQTKNVPEGVHGPSTSGMYSFEQGGTVSNSGGGGYDTSYENEPDGNNWGEEFHPSAMEDDMNLEEKRDK